MNFFVLSVSLFLIVLGSILVCQSLSYNIPDLVLIILGSIMLLLSMILLLVTLAFHKEKKNHHLPHLYVLFFLEVSCILNGFMSVINGSINPPDLSAGLAIGSISIAIGTVASILTSYYILI